MKFAKSKCVHYMKIDFYKILYEIVIESACSHFTKDNKLNTSFKLMKNQYQQEFICKNAILNPKEM